MDGKADEVCDAEHRAPRTTRPAAGPAARSRPGPVSHPLRGWAASCESADELGHRVEVGGGQVLGEPDGLAPDVRDGRDLPLAAATGRADGVQATRGQPVRVDQGAVRVDVDPEPEGAG